MLYQVNKCQIELFKKSNFKILKINNGLDMDIKKPRLHARVQVWRASLFAGAPSLWATCKGETVTQIGIVAILTEWARLTSLLDAKG